MSSEYGEKSREDLKGTARAQIKKAETSVPCTAIMDVNWKALIAAMNTQVDMLSEIQESLKTLATKEYITTEMDQQITILTEYAESSRELTEQFTEMMEQTVTAYTERMSTAAENLSSQVGKTSEQFSQSLSSEQETVRAFTKRSIWISLIPTAVLIVWELIRHIFLLT